MQKKNAAKKHPQEHINSYVLVGFHSCQSFLSSRVVCVTAVSNLAHGMYARLDDEYYVVSNPHSACTAEGCKDNVVSNLVVVAPERLRYPILKA